MFMQGICECWALLVMIDDLIETQHFEPAASFSIFGFIRRRFQYFVEANPENVGPVGTVANGLQFVPSSISFSSLDTW